MIKTKISRVVFLLLSQAAFIASVLPESLPSRFLLALSYDGEIEHLNTIIIIARIICFLAGEIFLILSFSSLRQSFLNICLPYPSNEARLPLPGMENTSGWIAMILFCTAWVLPVHLGLIIDPNRLSPLLREDGIFETLQVIMYFAGGGIMIYSTLSSIRYVGALRFPFVFWGFLGIFMIFIGLEEISYGQRIIGFYVPEYWNKINQQNEFNLHNVATGFCNRLVALVMICFGFFLPAIALFSARVGYLLSRFKAEFIAGPWMLCFAMGAMYFTPKNYNLASIDEQAAICILTCIVLLLLLARTAINKNYQKSTVILGAFGLAAFSTVAINQIYTTNWTAGNFAEEVKETFIPLGLFGYSLHILMLSLKLKHPKHEAPEVRIAPHDEKPEL